MCMLVIRCESFHKIGWTISISSRLRDLSIGNPFELTLVHLFSFTNARAVETALHQAFSSKRIRGEWFNLSSRARSSTNVCWERRRVHG